MGTGETGVDPDPGVICSPVVLNSQVSSWLSVGTVTVGKSGVVPAPIGEDWLVTTSEELLVSWGSLEGPGLALAARSSPGILLLIVEGSVVGLELAAVASSSSITESSFEVKVVSGTVFPSVAIAPGGDDSSVPVDDSSVPVDDSSVPVDDSSVPLDDSSVPVDDSSVPVNLE